MRNRLIVILLSALSAVSCLKGGGYESSYRLVANFDGFSEAWDKNYYNGEFYGDDKAFFEGAITEDNLVIFNCLYEKDMNDFSGFGLSLVTVKDEGYDARFSVNTETAYSGEVFALFHNNPEIKATSSGLQSDYHVFFATTQGTCTPVSCMVNNTKLVADGIAAYNAAQNRTYYQNYEFRHLSSYYQLDAGGNHHQRKNSAHKPRRQFFEQQRSRYSAYQHSARNIPQLRKWSRPLKQIHARRKKRNGRYYRYRSSVGFFCGQFYGFFQKGNAKHSTPAAEKTVYAPYQRGDEHLCRGGEKFFYLMFHCFFLRKKPFFICYRMQSPRKTHRLFYFAAAKKKKPDIKHAKCAI